LPAADDFRWSAVIRLLQRSLIVVAVALVKVWT